MCYDYSCERNVRTYFVEVKGTQTDGSLVILTRNEVEHANKHSDQSIFVLVRSIQIKKKSKKIVASGGKILVLHPWRVREKDLKVIQYTWRFS